MTGSIGLGKTCAQNTKAADAAPGRVDLKVGLIIKIVLGHKLYLLNGGRDNAFLFDSKVCLFGRINALIAAALVDVMWTGRRKGLGTGRVVSRHDSDPEHPSEECGSLVDSDKAFGMSVQGSSVKYSDFSSL